MKRNKRYMKIATILSESAWDKVAMIYRSCRQEIQWRLTKESWISALKLSKYKNYHRGQRCFIIGNGPSLNQMDLFPLQNEYTFGLNRIYLLFPKLGFQTSYLVSINNLVINQFSDEFNELQMPKFIRWSPQYSNPIDTAILLNIHKGNKFSKNAARCLYAGSTVTYAAMQLAYYMGFQTAILIGVDHFFSTKGPAHKLVESKGEDPNHFAPNYFGKGVKWNLPDLEGSERAYHLAKTAFERDGRQILDATVDGKLRVFPKIDFFSLF